MAIAEVNGQRIGYTDSGGSGPAVLLSHGFLMDRTMFDSQVEALAGPYRCVAWDERGFGETTATESFSYWDSAADAVALLDHLNIDRAVFVGMSQGGFLSLRAALANPERVAALCLIDSQPGIDPPETLEGYQGMLAHWMGSEPLGEVGTMVAGLILGEPELMAYWVAIWESRDRSQIQFPGETLMTRDDITERMSEITCPVLSIHGEDDQAITIDKADDLQAMVSDGRGVVRVPGAAHAPNMSHPDIVNPALADFLADVTS